MEKLEPCCKPKHASKSCGDVNFLGIPQYKVCDDPTTHVYWDSDHPVESTWKAVVDLFYNTSGFVIGANTLESWLSQTSVKPPPAPASAPALAPGELYRMVAFRVSNSLVVCNFTSLLNLLQWTGKAFKIDFSSTLFTAVSPTSTICVAGQNVVSTTIMYKF